jgi:hypothetical protein
MSILYEALENNCLCAYAGVRQEEMTPSCRKPYGWGIKQNSSTEFIEQTYEHYGTTNHRIPFEYSVSSCLSQLSTRYGRESDDADEMCSV